MSSIHHFQIWSNLVKVVNSEQILVSVGQMVKQEGHYLKLDKN